jgi:hypothetical protein
MSKLDIHSSANSARAMTSVPHERFLTERDVAARWSITVKALQRWGCIGGGPRVAMIGSRVGYTLAEIE